MHVMNGTTFDALATARNLEAARLGREQAEVIAGACRQAAGADHRTLATKADIAAVKWVLGFVAIFLVAISARLFGIIRQWSSPSSGPEIIREKCLRSLDLNQHLNADKTTLFAALFQRDILALRFIEREMP